MRWIDCSLIRGIESSRLILNDESLLDSDFFVRGVGWGFTFGWMVGLIGDADYQWRISSSPFAPIA